MAAITSPFTLMMSYAQWGTYKLAFDAKNPHKPRKLPTNAKTGQVMDVTDRAQYSSYETAYARHVATGEILAFFLTPDDPFFCLDIDSGAENGAWKPLTLDLMHRFAGCAIEVSQSGTGIHIFGTTAAVPPHARKNTALGIEVYTQDRGIAVTMAQASGDSGFNATVQFCQLVVDYFQPTAKNSEYHGWTDEPYADYDHSLDDDEALIERAIKTSDNSANVRFGGLSFNALFTGNEEAIAKVFPSITGDVYDRSSADGSLACHLHWWTGGNCERVKRLMQRSALARDKWEYREDYLEYTIITARAVVGDKYARPREGSMTPEIAAKHGVKQRDGVNPFMPPAEQLNHFEGCVYVIDTNKIWAPRVGRCLDKQRFDVIYSGYRFVMSHDNAKTEKSAFVAYTQNLTYEPVMADTLCFRPEHAPGEIVDLGGVRGLNSYVPIDTMQTQGDASFFIDHLNRLFGEDAMLVLTFMACCVRYPGYKAQWTLLIQGAEGNGKTMLARILRYAIGRKYSMIPKTETMKKTGNQFNSWLDQKLFIAIEEILIKGNPDFLNTIKDMVTNEETSFESKGVDQYMGDNRANFMLFTNHKDAIPVTTDQRRFSILFSRQQTAQDCLRDGLTEGYFRDIYARLKGEDDYAHLGKDYGYRVLNHYLRTCAIDERFDFTRAAQRAPATASSKEAVRLSMTGPEQELLDAIEEGRPGFNGGWVSSLMFAQLLERKNYRMTHNQRHATLEKMGYTRHPRLTDGRTNNVVRPDNGKPRLYTIAGHLSWGLETASLVENAYERAQDDGQAQLAFPKIDKQ